ncbi:PQQ-binding-like beta-propeller repeat protein [Nocardiopsis sp. N85]|uniref:outer membrane protein assembly factor BamB family protein n=1 Tax=Nocardiopsis sp. N85 TaxID=3029400 RepID=UPI00237EF23C|nr:PQQ-binding-like beta-propeller repeat protein [Nocardiopsis sp. N85]MDE3723051.1 PQQ-binding-like beta-propeller repeat protein [Nocardiopsis sp. N85]
MAVRTPWIIAVSAAVVALGVIAALVWADARVDHAVVEGHAPRPETIGTVSEVAWEWETPEGHRLHHVLAGVSGALMVVDDGVIALDGETGDELWRYRARDRRVADAAVTPDRETLLLSYAVGDGGEGGGEDVLVFATGTGEIVGEHRVPGGDARRGYLGDGLRISVSDGDPVTVTAESVYDGAPVWSRALEAPIPDPTRFHLADGLITPEAVIVAGSYEGAHEEYTVLAVALEPDTGRVLWEREYAYTDATAADAALTVSPDDSVLLLEMPYTDTDGRLIHQLLEPASGAERAGTFLHDRERRRVWFGEDGYVDHGLDGEVVEYRYVGFDGTVREEVTAPARPGERETHRGWALSDGVLRVHFLEGAEHARGPVTVEVLAWDGGVRRIPVDLSAGEPWPGDESHAYRDGPVIVRVPGAILVTEDTGRHKGTWRVVALR